MTQREHVNKEVRKKWLVPECGGEKHHLKCGPKRRLYNQFRAEVMASMALVEMKLVPTTLLCIKSVTTYEVKSKLVVH
jgi:hypothetical protein